MTTRATLVQVTFGLAVSACSSDSTGSSDQPAPSQITVTAGDAQLADVHDTLPQPLRFAVVDSKGRPVAGVTVTFVVTLGDGTVPHPQLVTAADGTVETAWAMGSIGGVQAIEARVSASLFTTATAATCVPGDCFPETRLDGPLSDATLLTLATYDGSGQTVHPDIVHGHGASHGFWLAITPYPGGDLTHENPSIFRSDDANQWTVPAGVTNPLALPNAFYGYLSDPDIIFNPSDQRLWMFYRAYSSEQNVISVVRSSNGTNWDAPTVVLTAPSHQLVSPSIVRIGPAAPWEMWAVNAGPQGCSAATTTVERRTSPDGLTWSAGTPVNLAQPGQTIWHIDVEWVAGRSEYWAIYNTYPTGGTCATHALYIARSPDGVHWTTSPSPIARSGLTAAFSDIIYRSTFMADSKGNRVLLLMSGASYTDGGGYVWRTASVSTTASDLFAIAAIPSSAFINNTSYRRLPPPEADVGH